MHRLWDHARLVGLLNTDELTFRAFLLAEIMQLLKTAQCQTEWHRFDLLVQSPQANLLIELKYYISRRTTELDGAPGGWKGEAGPQNEGEFWACIDKLRKCCLAPIQGKYIVLVYEEEYARRSQYSFVRSYGNLAVSPDIQDVLDITHPGSSTLACKLLTIA